MAAWRADAVLPLRSVRKALKERQSDPAIEALRSDVKKAELLAEQIQIAMTELWLRDRRCAPGLPLRAGLEFIVSEYGGRDCRDDRSLSAAIDAITAAANGVSSA